VLGACGAEKQQLEITHGSDTYVLQEAKPEISTVELPAVSKWFLRIEQSIDKLKFGGMTKLHATVVWLVQALFVITTLPLIGALALLEVFGAPLDELLNKEGGQIPRIVLDCVSYIEKCMTLGGV
jgi:hypothetical protein